MPRSAYPSRVRARSAAPIRPGLRAEGGRQHRGHDTVGGPDQGALQRGARGFEQPVAGRGDPAADDEAVGVERGDQVGQADTQPVADVRERLVGEQVAGLGSGGDHQAGQQLGVARALLLQHRRPGAQLLPGIAHQRVAAGVLLPAPAATALTGQATGRHLHVAELAGHAVVPAVQPAAQDDATTDPGAERHHDGEVGAARRAVRRLGVRRGGGVVLQHHRHRANAARGGPGPRRPATAGAERT